MPFVLPYANICGIMQYCNAIILHNSLFVANTSNIGEKHMKKIVIILMLVVLIALSISTVMASADTGSGISVTSKEGILMSADGQILYQHCATDKRPIASMTKIMTLLCIYDAVGQGKISLDDDVLVSHNASSMGGSQVYLDGNTTHKASQLIKSIIVCSANDSCVAMAEHISGSVEAFVSTMNSKASSMQLVATQFANCTGLPEASQYSCAVDVANMMRELIQYDHYRQCAGIWMEDYVHPDGRVTGMTNTNKLVKYYNGCDGGKTGFTNEAMHCLSATAMRGDTRLFAVVIGGSDSKTRFAEVSNLLNYGFANYESKTVLDSNSPLDDIAIVGGKADNVQCVAEKSLVAFGAKGRLDYQLNITYSDNLIAPIAQGDVVGLAELVVDGQVLDSCNILASSSIDAKSYWDYLQQLAY